MLFNLEQNFLDVLYFLKVAQLKNYVLKIILIYQLRNCE